LNNNGSFLYKTKTGTFTVSGSEYKLLKLLLDNKNSIVSNDVIIKHLFQREESKYWRMRVNAVIRNIKKGLGILPKNSSFPDIIINHRKLGYVLDL
jgi:DNA-binding response OmpR family regulator